MSLERDLRIQDYLYILLRRKAVISFTFLAVLCTVFIYTRIQTPIYQANGKLRVEPPMSSVALPGMVSQDSPWDPWTAPQTEAKVIQGAEVAHAVAERLGWISPESTEDMIIDSIGKVQAQISALPEKQTTLISVTATGPNALETSLLVNATIESYIDKGIKDRSSQSRQTKDFVAKQMEDARIKLKNAEETIKKYRQRHNISSIGQTIASRLGDAEEKRRELLEEYTEVHPQIRKLDAQIRELENHMRNLPIEQIELARLTRDVTINEDLYTMLLKRYKQAEIAERDIAPTAFIVSRAVPPKYPIRPNMRMNMLIGTIIGLFLGIFFAFLAENVDTSIGNIEDLEKFMELPVLGVIGQIPSSPMRRKAHGKQEVRLDRLRSKLIIYHKPTTPAVENYHTLRTNIRALTPEGTRTGILFTSAGVSEGKTLTAANFAISAAQAEVKTLLIEADLRRPSISSLFGLKRVPGISEILSGSATWQEAIRGTTELFMGNLDVDRILRVPGIENLNILSSGKIPANPVDVLSSSALHDLMNDLKTRYDMIVLDCPPVLLFADALLWGPHADHILLVYQYGRIGREALKRAKEQLVNVKSSVVGVVMNSVRSDNVGHYYAYNYNYGYSYYASKEDQEDLQ